MPTYDSLGDFARAVAPAVAAEVRALREGVIEGMAEEGLATARRLAPVRSGKLRASFARATEGETKLIVATAPHARVIDRGRKRSKNPKLLGKAKKSRRKGTVVQKGKMLGSKEAPRGISGPTGRRILKAAPAITARVVAEIESRRP